VSRLERLRRGRSTSGLLAAGFVAAFTLFVIIQFWTPDQEITTDRLISFVVVGITLGSIYAIAAAGLVVTYTTSGIFNFAQGAMGMAMAFVYWELKENQGIQPAVAVIITVLIVAPLFGALIERVLMRRIADASLVAQLVVTIGLMLALIGIVNEIWPPTTSYPIQKFFYTSSLLGSAPGGFTVGSTFVFWSRLITIVAGILIAIGIRLVMYRTRLGVAMRAVVDNRELASLNGARPGRTSAFAWALGTSLAALAGIFLAEELSSLSAETLTLFIVEAFAAAIIGRLRSLPMTVIGGMIIGLALSFQRTFLTLPSRWTGAGNAIPFIILFLALLFLPQARIEGRRVLRHVTARVPSMRRALLGFVALFVAMLLAAGILDRPDVRRVTLALVVAFAMLSLVPLTGWAGQISLAQITFVGIGAWASLEFTQGSSVGIFGLELYPPGSPWALVAATVVAVPFGMLMALPALRLQGLYLALASMAFALMAKPLFFDQPEVFGGEGRATAVPKIFGYSFDQPFTFLGIDFPADAGFLLLITVLFAAVGLVVVRIRRGSFGRRLVAMKDSPAACATLGVNLPRTKLMVYALSAAIAGFAGGLTAMHLGSASTTDFEMLAGLQYVLLLVVGGVAVVSGAVLGGFFLQSFTWVTVIFPGSKVLEIWKNVGPGLAGIGIGRQPDGIIPTVGHDWRERQRRSREKAAANRPPGVPSGAAAPSASDRANETVTTVGG
jgi:branched-chain amino acid transport system permease protein